MQSMQSSVLLILKVIKAGFSVFSASLQSKILLSQFRVYCFSDFKTVEKDPSRQLFSFYYGIKLHSLDQLQLPKICYLQLVSQ